MSAVIRKEGLSSGDVYLQRFGDEAAADYWTADVQQAHVFDTMARASEWVERLDIAAPVTVVEVAS